MTIVLASKSPARLKLLQENGFNVITCPTDCEETTTKTLPGDVVQDLASLKMSAYRASSSFRPDLPALACDTLLFFDGKLIGKAHSEEDARAQLKMLSGKTHQVYSGYSLFIDGKLYEGFDHTDVTFCNITNKMLDDYIASLEWKGAAGSYRIGGLADKFISNVKGSVSTVVGLPLEKISDIIKALRV